MGIPRLGIRRTRLGITPSTWAAQTPETVTVTVWFSLTKMSKNEKIMNSLTKTKTKTKKWWKRKRKCQNSKTCHSTKVPAYNTLFNTALTGAYYGHTPYGVESVTNGGRYLGRSSTHICQQVWYSLVVCVLHLLYRLRVWQLFSLTLKLELLTLTE